MPVPASIDELSPTPASNSPAGSEPVGPFANDYFQAAFAFIKQLANGGLKPTAAVDLNGQKLTNLADGTVSSTSTDAVTGKQLRSVYKPGEVKMWHGAVANIASVWGPGWQLADGTNGTADLRDRFIVGAGSTYNPNDVGGNRQILLTASQMPAHSHVVNDPGHTHPITMHDPGHIHPNSDPGHAHPVLLNNGATGNGARGAGSDDTNGYNSTSGGAFTGVTVGGAFTGVTATASGAFTGITTQNAGGYDGIDIRPPYYALCFLEFVGP